MRTRATGQSHIDSIRRTTTNIEMELMSSDPDFRPNKKSLMKLFSTLQEHVSLLQRAIAQEYPE